MQRVLAGLIGVFGVLGLTFGASAGVDDSEPSSLDTGGIRLVALADLTPLPRSSSAADEAPPTSQLTRPASPAPALATSTTGGSSPAGDSSFGDSASDEQLASLLEEISSGAVRFEFEKSDLDARATEVLDRLAVVLVERPVARIDVFGHTDSIGSDATNIALSRARAVAVVDHLVSRGVQPTQLEVRAMGKSAPVADNGTEQGRSANRRAEARAGEDS